MRPGAPSWLADYIDSMAGFPNAAHDDEVDSTTQALNYMIGRGGGIGILDYYPAMARTPTAEPETVRLRVPQGLGGVTLEDGTAVAADDYGCLRVA